MTPLRLPKIAVPAEHIETSIKQFGVCGEVPYWIANTGCIDPGDRRPIDDYGTPMPDVEWYAKTLESLCVRLHRQLATTAANTDDYDDLQGFSVWADFTWLGFLATHKLPCPGYPACMHL